MSKTLFRQGRQGDRGMIDPVPLGYTTLGEAVPRLAAQISDADVRLRNIFDRVLNVPFPAVTERSALVWSKRELAIVKLYESLQRGELVAIVRDPKSAEMFRVISHEWRRCAFWREMIIAGRVRASAGESIERHDGRTLLIETIALDRWLASERKRKPLVADNDCRTWLEA